MANSFIKKKVNQLPKLLLETNGHTAIKSQTELSVIIEDVYGFRWNSLLDLEIADYRFEDFEEFAEDYVDTSDLLKQFGK